MEEILASIRRIIADDEVLPLSRSASPAPSLRQGMPAAPVRHSSAPTPVAAPPSNLRNSIKPPVAETSALEGVAADRFAAISRRSSTAETLMPERRSFASAPHQAQAVPQAHAVPQAPQPQAYQPQAPQAYSEPRYAEPRYAEPAAAPLVSQATDASVAQAFEALTSSLAMKDPAEMGSLVSELLRPMLKQWLDDNLPVLVERLVRTEIERVARGGRGA